MGAQAVRNGAAKSGLRLAALLAIFAPAFMGSPGWAATTELVVSDRLSGIAIYGFDPVSYFIDGEAREGVASFEWKHAGVVWRFRNEGDRAAFAARPDDYMPRFGGYDPLGVARGISTSGYPSLFVIHESRLFLFASEENRTAFLANPKEAVAAAEAGWPQVVRKLSP